MGITTKVALHLYVPFIVGNKGLLLEAPSVVLFSPTFANIVPSILVWIEPVRRILASFLSGLGLTISRSARISALVMGEARLLLVSIGFVASPTRIG